MKNLFKLLGFVVAVTIGSIGLAQADVVKSAQDKVNSFIGDLTEKYGEQVMPLYPEWCLEAPADISFALAERVRRHCGGLNVDRPAPNRDRDVPDNDPPGGGGGDDDDDDDDDDGHNHPPGWSKGKAPWK